MFFLIGIDDTDDERSKGTGELGWGLGLKLEQSLRCRLISVTRHQLLQHPALHYTTHNSCVCVVIESTQDFQRDIELFCRTYILRESAHGSDPGFALAAWSSVTPEIPAWGKQAKLNILERQEAIDLARRKGISIAGFTGSGNGVIGALAAIGLYFSGNNGRFLWLPGLRELNGVYTLEELLTACPFDRVENLYGRTPIQRDRINVGEWARPILRGGRSVLLLEVSPRGEPYEWVTLDRERIDQISS